MQIHQARRAGFGLTAGAAIAAAMVLAAPQASALVQSLTINDSTHYVGTSYTLTADVTATSFLFPVTFSANGTKIGDAPVRNGKATISWTPTEAGTYQLKAVQELISSKTITVEVVEKPSTPPGGGSGSADLGGLLTGSAG